MAYYLSKEVSGTVVCGCYACSEAASLDVVISGITTCFTCEGASAPYFTVTSVSVNGSFSLAQTTPTTWEYVIVDGYTWKEYSDSGCTMEDFTDTGDIVIIVTCEDGLYTVQIYLDPGFTGTGDLFSGSGLIDTAISNTTGCGGTVTISEP